MEHMTIGEVSARFQISARMLRYYEKAGLLESTRKENYAYRIYQEEEVRKIQQIILLRKLQLPLKQIRSILNRDKAETVRILKAQIQNMDENEKTIQTMKKALERLLEILCEKPSEQNDWDFTQESSIVSLTEFLPMEKHHLTEGGKRITMKEMIEKGSCVRIVLLPPCTVAACQFTGENPEETVGGILSAFVRSSRLYEKKPDARMFGFNHPDPEPGNEAHGYEVWATIPDDLEVPEPLVKKHFDGGMYAAYTIHFPDFHEWSFLSEWVQRSDLWQADYHDPSLKDMDGCLEEHLNWIYSAHKGWPEDNPADGKIDLLIPIKRRETE